jgi:hypothetical protein
MDVIRLREIVLALGEASARDAARAWDDGRDEVAAYFEGEAQRSLDVLALIDADAG